MGSVAVLANEPFGVRLVHAFHKDFFVHHRHGGFANLQRAAQAAKVLRQMDVTNFVRLDARVAGRGSGSLDTGFAEHLLNIRPQMGCLGANEKFVTQTKQTKIGPCEQVRVN
jgi:hypothetical protein